MKKCLFPLFLLVVRVLNAQDIEEVEKYFILSSSGKYRTEAKAIVDKYLSVEKNTRKPDGWFFKGFIYNSVSKDSALSFIQSAALKQDAFSALKKYREMDPKAEVVAKYSNPPEKKMELLNSVFYEIYAGYAQDLGISAYNKKEYLLAANYFEEALTVQEYITKNEMAMAGGYRLPRFDTLINLYAGAAYAEVKMPEKAIPYFQKIVDEGIGGEQYLSVYQQLSDHYRIKKDSSAFVSVIGNARKLYPQYKDVWMEQEIEYATGGVAAPMVFERYESLIARYPENFALNYNYAAELNQYVNSEEQRASTNNEYRQKMRTLAAQAVKIEPESIDANFLMANILYNSSFDISDAAAKIKGQKPDDLKRKKEMNGQALRLLDETIPFAEKVTSLYGSLSKPSNREKIQNRESMSFLRDIYSIKKDIPRADKYDKMIKALQ